MGAPDDPVATRGSLDQIGDQGAKFRWNRVARCIRHIDHFGSGADHFAEHLHQKIRIAARRILSRELDIIHELLSMAHSLHGGFDNLLPRHSQLVFQVDIRRGNEGVDARVFGVFHRFQGPVDVPFLGTCETNDPRPADLLTYSAYRVEVTVRRGGKSRFDHIDAKLLQLAGNNYFLFNGHARAGRLFAIAERGIENLYYVIGGSLFHYEISSLIDPLASPRNENSRGNGQREYR